MLWRAESLPILLFLKRMPIMANTPGQFAGGLVAGPQLTPVDDDVSPMDEDPTPPSDAPMDALTMVAENAPLTPEDFAKFEVDPARKQKLVQRAAALPEDRRVELFEALTKIWGVTPEIADVNLLVSETIRKATESKTLAARNQSAVKTLEHYHALAARVSAMLNDGLADTPFDSLKIDGTKKHLVTVNENLTILSTAVYDMADMLGLDVPHEDNPDLPINVKALVRVLTVVACGTKTWAKTYEVGLRQQASLTEQVATLASRLQQNEDERIARAAVAMQKEVDERRLRLSRGNWFAVMTANGQYLTTSVGDDGGLLRVSPFSLRVTEDRSEAATFDSLDDARVVFDAVTIWAKRYRRVKDLFAGAGVTTNNLFIAASKLHKIEE